MPEPAHPKQPEITPPQEPQGPMPEPGVPPGREPEIAPPEEPGILQPAPEIPPPRD